MAFDGNASGISFQNPDSASASASDVNLGSAADFVVGMAENSYLCREGPQAH
jgi:hypothetical protein